MWFWKFYKKTFIMSDSEKLENRRVKKNYFCSEYSLSLWQSYQNFGFHFLPVSPAASYLKWDFLFSACNFAYCNKATSSTCESDSSDASYFDTSGVFKPFICTDSQKTNSAIYTYYSTGNVMGDLCATYA